MNMREAFLRPRDLLEQIYPALDRAQLLAELQPADKGKYYLLTCPKCNKREAYIYKNGIHIRCNRANQCQYSSSLWDYIQQRESLSNREVLEYLARCAGVPLPEVPQSFIDDARKAQELSALLEDCLVFFQESLKLDTDVQQYLSGRGYTPADIEAMGLGSFPGRSTTRAYLQQRGYREEQINMVNALRESGQAAWNREEYKLVFAYHTPSGYLKSLWGRLIRKLAEGEKESRKYLPFLESDRETLFGFHYGHNDLVLVEGYLDCLIAQARGFNQVAAIGSNRIAKAQVDFIKRLQHRTITLALDNDQAGQEGTRTTLLALTQEGFTCYVAELAPDCKDVDELIVKYGQEGFKYCLDHAMAATRWLAQHLVRRGNITTDKGRQEVFEQLVALANDCKNPGERTPVLEVLTSLGFDPKEMAGYLDSVQQRQAQEKRQKSYGVLLDEAKGRLSEGEGDGLGEFLVTKIAEVENSYGGVLARNKKSQNGKMQELYEQERKQEECELIGYWVTTETCKDFLPVERDLDGIQPGLYILGAQTNVGKTAFVSNLALHLARSNDDLKVLYFSFDDSFQVTATRMRAILAFQERNFTDMRRFQASNLAINDFRKRLEPSRQERKAKINQAFLEIIEAGKIELYDIADTPNLGNVEFTIRRNTNQKIAVVIDGLYNVAVQAGYAGGIREENIERANKIKALVDTYSIPVICTAEVRKRTPGQTGKTITIDDLMESGKFGYNANLVWLLSEPETENGKENLEMVTLSLEYAKNKLTGFKGQQEVQYFRKYSKMFVQWKGKKDKKTLSPGLEE